jgi:hypothetical protein
MNDKKLWKVFSEYIRLRDSDVNGYGKCITCNLRKFYKEMDCGHGIPRQHKATKFNERNNHLQCKRCNGFEGGKREVYKSEVDKRYGPGTWDKLEVMSRMTCKRNQFEIDAMEVYYKKQVKELLSTKNLPNERRSTKDHITHRM